MSIKINRQNRLLIVSALAALIGMVIYLVTSLTGYLAASVTNPWPILCTIISIVLLLSAAFWKEENAVLPELLTAAAMILILVSFYGFVMSRVSLAADVYFIPVNYPASEANALHISIAGVVGYLIADIALIVQGFQKKQQA